MKDTTKRHILKSAAAVLALFILTLSFAGCGAKGDVKEQIKRAHPEWYESIKPALDELKVTGYTEKDGAITIEIKNSTYSNDFARLGELHNTFIGKNPNYFSNGERFYFSLYKDGEVICYLSSCADIKVPKSRDQIDRYEIVEKETGRILYASVLYDELSCLTSGKSSMLLKDLHVLFVNINSPQKGTKNEITDWSFIGKFTGLKKMVLVTNWEYDPSDSMYDTFASYYPQIKVFTSGY